MKVLEKPIILPDWKVRALPHATQIRVPIKFGLEPDCRVSEVRQPSTSSPRFFLALYESSRHIGSTEIKCPCPVGTKLWVREAFGLISLITGYALTGDVPAKKSDAVQVAYAADADDFTESLFSKWRPARTMPRWAARHFLEVTGVKAERLREISLDDCEAEGVEFPPGGRSVANFAFSWDSTAKPGEKWADSPWVWVLTVKTLEGV